MLSVETIDAALKQQLKDKKLKSLEAQYFEYHMNKLAYEASGHTQYVEATEKKLDELKLAYEAISAIVIENNQESV